MTALAAAIVTQGLASPFTWLIVTVGGGTAYAHHAWSTRRPR